MNMDTNQSSQTQEVQEPSRKRTGRRVTKILLVMTLVLGLLIAPRVLAHGVFGDAQRGGRGHATRLRHPNAHAVAARHGDRDRPLQ